MKDISIPARIAALQRKGAYPIPYVADWTGEAENIFRTEPRLGMPAWFTGGKPGDGEVMFGKQNPVRQRECVMNMRCQICHAQLEPPVWFIAGWIPRDPTESISLQPTEPVIEEPPLCTECAVYALRVCPGLARDHPPPYSGNLVYLTWEYEWAVQAVTPLERPGTLVAHFVMAQLEQFETFTEKEFLETHDGT